MDANGIRRIEAELSVTLPERYALFLRNYSYDDIQDTFIIDPDTLISENHGCRDLDFWDTAFLVIGGDGCGNPLCLRLDPPSDDLWICEFDPPDGFSVEMPRDALEDLFRTFES